MKKYKNPYMMLIITMGLVLVSFSEVFLLFLFVVTKDTFGKITLVCLIICGAIGFLSILLKVTRQAFSLFSFNKQGVLNACYKKKDIFIAWDECNNIGIGIMPRGYGLYTPCIYFSKVPLLQKQIAHIQGITFSENSLWIQYSKEVMEEVLKYVPAERINNQHLIPQKEWIAWLSPPNPPKE